MAAVKWLPLLGLFLVVVLTVILHTARPGPLNDALIRELFGNLSKDQVSTQDLDEIRWERGSFTQARAIEAVVAFYDSSQCHACGWSEVWLLKYADGWKADRKLAESDRVSFRIVDIQGDGKREIWIESRGGNQGSFSSEGQLLTLGRDSISVMYANSGHDHYGAGAEGEAVRTHTVEFRDLDHDGLMEIIDTETRKFYHWTGERWISEYVQTGSGSHATVLKLEGDSFTILNDAIKSQVERLLPQGAMLRDSALIPSTQKTLVIYIQNPTIDPEPDPDLLLTCPGEINGQEIGGIYHLALFENGTLVNDTIIPSAVSGSTSESQWIIFRHTKAVIHRRFGGPKPLSDAQQFAEAKLLRLRDLNGDGLPHEFRLEVYVAACGHVEVLTAGYSAEQNKAVIYPIVEGEAVHYWHDNFYPDERGEVHWRFRCRDHANEVDTKKTFAFDPNRDVYVRTSYSETICEW